MTASAVITSLRDPCIGGAAVSPSDTADLPRQSRAICFATAGDIAVIWADGTENTIPAGTLLAGVLHSLQLRRIKQSGTTAVGLWAFY